MNHVIRNGQLTVEISERGAELRSVRGADGTEYLWQGDPEYWSDRALNIFPFVARLTEGKYSLDDNIYEMPIHGFAPYSDFRVTGNTGTRLTMELRDSAETLKIYPRRFCFRVVYSITGDTLTVAYEVENQDTRPMIFGLGGHPGFNVPLRDGLRFEDYRLRFSKPWLASHPTASWEARTRRTRWRTAPSYGSLTGCLTTTPSFSEICSGR